MGEGPVLTRTPSRRLSTWSNGSGRPGAWGSGPVATLSRPSNKAPELNVRASRPMGHLPRRGLVFVMGNFLKVIGPKQKSGPPHRPAAFFWEPATFFCPPEAGPPPFRGSLRKALAWCLPSVPRPGAPLWRGTSCRTAGRSPSRPWGRRSPSPPPDAGARGGDRTGGSSVGQWGGIPRRVPAGPTRSCGTARTRPGRVPAT